MEYLRAFIGFNRKLATALARRLPQARTKWSKRYQEVVAQQIARRPGQIIVDVGAGHRCAFADAVDEGKAHTIAVDVSLEQLQHNTAVETRVLADVMAALPFRDRSVDMIVSRTVLEHLQDMESFVAEARRVICDDGYFIHSFPSKFAPFAILNQLLPHALSQRLLFFFRPQMKGLAGFPAFYNRCYYSGFSALLRKHRFRLVAAEATYFSRYFDFFLPLFAVSAVYQMLVYALDAKDLAEHLLIVAVPE